MVAIPLAFVLPMSYNSVVFAQVGGDGVTPAVETVCDGLADELFGLCNAYCEAKDCDSDNPKEHLRRFYIMKILLIIFLLFSQLVYAETVDKIIAKVGTDVITMSDVSVAINEQRNFFIQILTFFY